MKFSYVESKLTKTLTISVTSELHGQPFTTQHRITLAAINFHRHPEYAIQDFKRQAIREHETAKQQRLAEAFGTTHATFTTSE